MFACRAFLASLCLACLHGTSQSAGKVLNHEVIVVRRGWMLYLNSIMSRRAWVKRDNHRWKKLKHTQARDYYLSECERAAGNALWWAPFQSKGMSEGVFMGGNLLRIKTSSLLRDTCGCRGQTTARLFSLDSSLFYDLGIKDSKFERECVCMSLHIFSSVFVHVCSGVGLRVAPLCVSHV